MDMIKKNLLSIICGVIALLAIVSLFWPTSGLYAELQTKVTERAAKARTLETLRNKPRTLPPSLNDPGAQPAVWPHFPTEPAIAAVRVVSDSMKSESAAVLSVVVQANQREVLSPNALPRPTSTFPIVNFQKAYARLMDYTNPDPAVRSNTLVYQILKPGTPPSEADIVKKQADIRLAIETKKTRYDGNGKALNGPEVAEEVAREVARVPDLMRSEVATNSNVYLRDTSLDVHTNIMNFATQPSPTNMFYAQLSVWLQEDIFKAIAAANAGSQNVITSPVKELIRIDIPDNPWIGANGNGSVGVDRKLALGVAGTVVPAAGLTGRVCNPFYDVVHFSLQVNVEAEQINKFLAELGRDRLMTVLDVQMTAVDSGPLYNAGYIFGDKPVVQLTLTVEKLLLRKWTVPLMPPDVLLTLGAGTDAPAAGTVTPPPTPGAGAGD